jgi:hypothetical protein
MQIMQIMPDHAADAADAADAVRQTANSFLASHERVLLSRRMV